MVLRFALLLVLAGSAVWTFMPLGDGDLEESTARVRIPPEVTWSPDLPGEGRLFTLRVRASIHSPIMGLRGDIAGEELHFRRVDDRSFESLAAAPIGAGARIRGLVRVAYEGGGEETIDVTVPVQPGAYRHERLTVAPRFGAPLDSADQARVDRERAKARDVARIAHRTRWILSDSIVMPRSSRVTSEFGNGREFNGQITSRHMGLDLQGLQGDTVRAPARGVVALVDDFLLAGRLVYLNHGAGLVSAYFHLSEQLVEAGDSVLPGTPIGRVGATGRVTGPHLHWVVRYGNTSVDPRSLLDVR